jgi:GTP-binding protein Era
VALLPEGPAYDPTEQRTDLTPELQAAELIREKALQLTREELPHAISVEVEELTEKVVRATIFVETESQKQIVIGKAGTKIRDIGKGARPEVEQLLGHPVYLELKVKVKPRWRRDEATLQRLGL